MGTLLKLICLDYWKTLSDDTRGTLINLGYVVLVVGFGITVIEQFGDGFKAKSLAIRKAIFHRISRDSGKLSRMRPHVTIKVRTILLIPIALLVLAAVSKWPYNFYILLRWVVCGCSAYTIIAINRTYYWGWTCALGIVAFLFNPILSLHFDRDTWAVLNIFAAAVLVTFMTAVKTVATVPHSGDRGPYAR